MDLVMFFGVFALTSFLFSILFKLLIIQELLKVFNPIQTVVGKVKHKKILKLVIVIIPILIALKIKALFNLNYAVYGAMLAFCNTLYLIVYAENKQLEGNPND